MRLMRLHQQSLRQHIETRSSPWHLPSWPGLPSVQDQQPTTVALIPGDDCSVIVLSVDAKDDNVLAEFD